MTDNLNTVKFGVKPVLPYSLEEAINRLRINISFLGSDTKKILIISSDPNEGKSFVAMNLWQQMGRAGDRTILLDADMRKSVMVKKYEIERTDGKELKGMSHYLSGDADISESALHTEIEGCDILPNTDNIINPSMLLESSRFAGMLDYMAENYRYVFVDAPPMGLVSDGEKIASLCDGAVLCVRSGVTSRAIIRNSIRQIERTGCPLLGIVLNRVNTQKGGYYHKYYGKRYYGSKYYGGEYYGSK